MKIGDPTHHNKLQIKSKKIGARAISLCGPEKSRFSLEPGTHQGPMGYAASRSYARIDGEGIVDVYLDFFFKQMSLVGIPTQFQRHSNSKKSPFH
jgi:hypothetical protein